MPGVGIVWMNVRSISSMRVPLCLAVLALAAGAVSADERSGSERAATSPLAVVREFSLPDSAGGHSTLTDWKASKAVVLFFLGTECPVSNGYAPLMADVAARYRDRGVLVVGVHCDPTLTAAAVREHATEYRLPFRLLLDPRQQLAKQVGARVTPEAIVLRPTGEVEYRGRLDNRYSKEGKRRLDPTTHELEDALAAVLAGQSPAVREAVAFGCPLPKLKAETDSKNSTR